MNSSEKDENLSLEVVSVSHQYGNSEALCELTLAVARSEIFGILGPNGSGKSTLFRLIATLVPIQSGTIRINGIDVRRETARARTELGVVFQSPSLDRKLTVLENIRCQAALYGLAGKKRDARIERLVQTFGLSERLQDRCEKLSGGLKRRVELAKGLLHQPRLLLLDEPSTGLDPSARLDLWQALTTLRQESGTTIVMTTHLLDEADKCDRIAILNQGRVVACDVPDTLRGQAGKTMICIDGPQPQQVREVLMNTFGLESTLIDQSVRLVIDDAASWLPRILPVTESIATSVTIGRPSLEDVFIAKTGHRFYNA